MIIYLSIDFYLLVDIFYRIVNNSTCRQYILTIGPDNHDLQCLLYIYYILYRGLVIYVVYKSVAEPKLFNFGSSCGSGSIFSIFLAPASALALALALFCHLKNGKFLGSTK